MANDKMILIGGQSGAGKSASLRNLKNPERVLYINAEANKALPFKNAFTNVHLTDPLQLPVYIEKANNSDKYDTIVLDSLTFLSDMYVTQYINTAPDGRGAWAEYSDYMRNLMQQSLGTCTKNIIILAHTLAEYNENTFSTTISIPVPGSLKKQGFEAFFSIVLQADAVPLVELEKHSKALVSITPIDEARGIKNVFRVRVSADGITRRVKTPMGMFADDVLYMDNDVQKVLDIVENYYK